MTKPVKKLRPFSSIFLLLLLLLLLAAGLSPAISAQELGFKILPGAALPLNRNLYDAGFGIGGGLDFTPGGFLSFVGVGLSGTYAMPQVRDGSQLSVAEGGLGPFFRLRLGDRFGLSAGAQVNYFNRTWGNQSQGGISFGPWAEAFFRLSPYLSLIAHGGYTEYPGEKPFRVVTAGGGIRVNILELVRPQTRVSGEKVVQNMIFPVSFAWYGDNPIAMVRVTNNEPNDITAVNLSFFLERYMSQPTLTVGIPRLKAGESADLPVTALFNASMLDLVDNINTNALVTIRYRSLGSAKTAELPVRMPIYHRNAMSWDDDRRAVSFVSAQDMAARLFARHVAGITEKRLRPGINRNMQYALGLLEALNLYGISYVIDPTSSYVEMSGDSGSLDSLNYPYQTLFYRGGDCDDLSILFCSLLEVLGIETAFITIPGHIYMAFDSGEKVPGTFSNMVPGAILDPDRGFIYYGGKAWVPLEITIPAEGFFRAWRTGVREWDDDTGAIYPLKEAWQVYPPVSVADASGWSPALPAEDAVTAAVEASLDRFGEYALRSQAQVLEAQLRSGAGADTRNRLGGLYGQGGMLARAAEEFNKVRNSDAQVNLANITYIQGRYREARDAYQTVLRSEPNHALACLGLARAAYELQDFAAVDAAWQNLKRINPALAGCYRYLNSFGEWSGRPVSYADRLGSVMWAPLGALAAGGDPLPDTGGLVKMLSGE
jgi:hypothetical protein